MTPYDIYATLFATAVIASCTYAIGRHHGTVQGIWLGWEECRKANYQFCKVWFTRAGYLKHFRDGE